jgi:predicted ATPase/DNA-binding CsgD family transcriptional regulator
VARRPKRRIAKRRLVRRPTRRARHQGPAIPPPPRRLHNLPTQLTTFIGREREIAEVQRLLGTTRLLTLTGAGGCGKTRLALQVAAEGLDSYPDGAWLVEFAPVTDPALVPKTVAAAVRVPERPGRDMIETLVDALRSKSMLLVLDNCEHLVSACADLAIAVLRACPQVRVLATSREKLTVPGESLWRVPSLSLPEGRRVPPSEDVVRYDAVRLFVDRAKTTVPEFAVTSENAHVVVQVCERLDGIPLAIELAAARVKVLAVEQLAARLDNRFRLLTGGSRAVLPRQQTLQAAMDWSHDLLSEKEKVLFRRLSVFMNGCTLEAVEAVCSASTVDPAHILDLLTQLVDKSLVLVDTHHGEARYRLLEIVRQYGHERLLESEEVESTRRRHRDWYLEWTDRNSSRLKRDPLLEAIGAEHDNLRAALEFSIEGNHTEPGLRLVGRLSYFWYVNGDWSEGRKWLDRVLALWGDARTAFMTQPLLGATFLARSQGEYEKARAFAQQGLAIARETASNRYVSFFLFNLGVVALQHDRDVNRAKALFDESTILSRQLGVTDLLAWNFAQFGHIARDSGEYERAASLYEESLAFARQYDENHIIAYALRNIAVLALHARDYARAAARFTESIDMHRAPNWVTEECLTGMAQIATVERQYERAGRLFGAADALREALGVRRSLVTQIRYDDAVAATRAALGDPAFAIVWGEGRAMTLEQAIEFALTVEQTASAKANRAPRTREAKPLLTMREQEVARLVARGLTNRQIAGALAVSARTAGAHVQNILNKLGFSSRAQIAAWAVEQNLTAPRDSRPASFDAGSRHDRQPT